MGKIKAKLIRTDASPDKKGLVSLALALHHRDHRLAIKLLAEGLPTMSYRERIDLYNKTAADPDRGSQDMDFVRAINPYCTLNSNTKKNWARALEAQVIRMGTPRVGRLGKRRRRRRKLP